MFKLGKRYRHISSLDIDLEMQQYLGENEVFVSYIVSYWNRHLKRYQGGRMQVVSIQKSDFSKWRQV